jgi:hypothetical protein
MKQKLCRLVLDEKIFREIKKFVYVTRRAYRLEVDGVKVKSVTISFAYRVAGRTAIIKTDGGGTTFVPTDVANDKRLNLIKVIA